MPATAIAWIVAIEHYSGAELDLQRPVGGWALDFAELMLERTAERVVLSASLQQVPTYEPRLAELARRGVSFTDADRKGLEDALDLLQAVEGAMPAESLFLYWVGHGIMAPSRQLICGDSKGLSSLRSITADSLLTRLRAPEFPRLQMGFLECCAQLIAPAPAALDLGGDGRAVTRQFFYHAASAGEFASGSTDAGFSSTVLKSLKALESLPTEHPDTFFDALKVSLDDLPLQTHPFLQRTYESGDVWSSGDSSKPNDVFDASRVADLAFSEFDFLWQCVRGRIVTPLDLARARSGDAFAAFVAELRHTAPGNATPDLLEKADRTLMLVRFFEPLCLRLRLYFDDWLAIYNRVADEDHLGPVKRVEDLPGILLRVLDQTRHDFAARSLLKLLELAARRAEDRVPAGAKALRDAGVKHLWLKEHYAGVVESMRVVNDDLYLLLELGWDPDLKTASLRKAWIFPWVDGGFYPPELPGAGKLAEQINAVVEGTLKKFPERPLRVELLAPNDLLCAPRELLELVNSELDTRNWLEAEHAMTMRWSNRMKGDNDSYKPGTWKAAGLAARTAAERAETLSCLWRPEGAGSSGNYTLIGLTFPGPCPSNPQRNRRQFFDELLKGNPYMCWPRNHLDDPETFKRAAVELLQRSRLGTLSACLRAGRTDPELSELVVLIDEPHRNPYNDVNRLFEVEQRGT